MEVYFENIDKHISNYLDIAKDEIYVAVAWITNPQLISKLNECQKKRNKSKYSIF